MTLDAVVELCLPARKENLSAFLETSIRLAHQYEFPEPRCMMIELAVEEAVVNVIDYAYPDSDGDIVLSASWQAPNLSLEIKDRGQAFDVLALPDPDLESDLSERQIGGLGIYFFKNIANEVHYRREAGWNILTMIFNREVAPAS